jgi:hypothetical protein
MVKHLDRWDEKVDPRSCTEPRDFARFEVSSLFFPELLCFFKVGLLRPFLIAP